MILIGARVFLKKKTANYLLFQKKVLTLRSVLEAVLHHGNPNRTYSGSSAVGSVHVWGACGRQFESGLPDQETRW